MNKIERAAYNKKYKLANPKKIAAYQRKYYLAGPNKFKSHNAAVRALKNGTIPRQILCQYCGAHTKLEMHHPDLTYNLDNALCVQQICRPCHRKEHAYLRSLS